MNKLTQDFLDKITKLEVRRGLYETDYEMMKKFHKTRLCLCYDYLKLLTTLRGGTAFKEDYQEVKKLTQKFEEEYLTWKKSYKE